MSGTSFEIRGFIPFHPSRDLAAAADFYGRELGLELVREEPGRIVFRICEGAYLGFYLHEAAAFEHRGLVLGFCTEQVDALYKSLRHHGVETEGRPKAIGRTGGYAFYARDPDGYRVEVRAPLESS